MQLGSRPGQQKVMETQEISRSNIPQNTETDLRLNWNFGSQHIQSMLQGRYLKDVDGNDIKGKKMYKLKDWITEN